ncbi:MAG: HypC/HybG/HupF family hydrogenase formation chaperone [Deltaproteobacteria bacterium]
MCLAVPGKILSIDKTIAEVELSGVVRKVDIRLVDGVKAGDYVLVHAGFGIEKIDEKEAKKTLKLLKQVSFGE